MFLSLYEEVKNARNRYVSQIAATSQDLAEMNERIKILQNEVDILKSESKERDRALIETKHQVITELAARDNNRSDLNRKEFEFRQKLATIG